MAVVKVNGAYFSKDADIKDGVVNAFCSLLSESRD